MTRALRVAAAVLMLLALGETEGQAASPAERQASAERALVEGRPEEALALTNRILAERPNAHAALFVKAAALIDLGDPAEAAEVAGDAFRAATTRDQRLQAARLAGRARFLAGHYARAEWWLRRASNNTATAEEEAAIGQAFQIVRRANPLTFQVGFGIAPTNNFNRGAEDGSVLFEGLGVFELPPDQRPLSGIEYNGDLRLEYRISESPEQQTHLGLYVYGRTYTPSSSARDSVPGISGSDYSLGLVDVFLRHDRLIFPKLGASRVSVHNGRLFYGGEHYWDYVRVAIGQDVRLSAGAVVSAQVSSEVQDGVPLRHEDTRIHTLSATYGRVRENGDRVRFRLAKQIYDTDAFEASYDDYKFEVDYQWGRPLMGVALGGSIGVGHADYERFFLSLDGRKDDYVFGTLRAVWTDVSFYGFSPRVDVTAEKRWSNVGQYARSTAALRLGLATNF